MKLMRFNQPDLWAVSPIERMSSLRDQINRLFEAPFGELARAGEFFNGWAPALDLREDKENLVASIELPGLKKEQIDVSVHDGVLSVAGERADESSNQEATCYRTERFYGRFHRTLTLPKPVKVDAIKATYKDGILTVTLPKTEEAKPKQITVNVG
ncbi:MAG: Hsp20/alpha crystallin family protein [Verrucomicrobia bacterium]|nr:Hsp20/alpha crystallin family protein [Verrucomicrobiota bacterium]